MIRSSITSWQHLQIRLCYADMIIEHLSLPAERWNKSMTHLFEVYLFETMIPFSYCCFVSPGAGVGGNVFVIKRTHPCFILQAHGFFCFLLLCSSQNSLVFPKARCLYCRENHSCRGFLSSRICHAVEQDTDAFGI